jgi:hypothetical protein
MNYPSNVYGWNHYEGDSPSMDSIGLPLDYSGADLPTSVPTDTALTPSEKAATDQLPYSPALMEMGTVGATAHAQVKSSAPLTPAKPGLWQTVGNAIFGGSVGMSKTNSTAAVASGENTAIPGVSSSS